MPVPVDGYAHIALGKPAEEGHEIIRRRHRLVMSLLDIRGKVVLDFGCGNGAQTSAFASVPCRVIGIDVDFPNLRVLQQQLLRAGIRSILPVQYDGVRLPLPDHSVDTVVSFEVLEHVPDESAALTEVRRVLKPGGHMVLTVPNKWWIFETHGASLPLLPWNRVPFFSWLPDRFHRRFAQARIYRRGDIVRLVQRHGFTVHTVTYITAPMDVVKVRWLQKLLRRSVFAGDTTRFGVLATSILVHCTTP